MHSNFAPVIKMDGSLVALTRGAIVHAADWRNVSTYVTVGKWHDEGEDPFLWEANGVLHNIVHVVHTDPSRCCEFRKQIQAVDP